MKMVASKDSQMLELEKKKEEEVEAEAEESEEHYGPDQRKTQNK